VKVRKTVTPKKAAANKKNAQENATGPRTAAGKSAASRNAITHAFFTRELVLNDKDARQLKASARKLRLQLSPQTELQENAFSLIVTCIGRCKVGLRQEMSHVTSTRGLGEPTVPQMQHGSEDHGAGIEWFLAGKQALRDGIKLIEAVRTEYKHLGRIDAQWNAALDKAFGSQFRQLLTEWPSSDKEVVLLAHCLKEHSRRYGTEMPSFGDEPASEAKGEKPPEVILDPEQNGRMVLKLLQQQEDFLSGLRKTVEQRASGSASAQNEPVDFAPRYFPSARKELERAVKWYLKLKVRKL
jgi:hypothetical protein